jgi:hypothetical protein
MGTMTLFEARYQLKRNLRTLSKKPLRALRRRQRQKRNSIIRRLVFLEQRRPQQSSAYKIAGCDLATAITKLQLNNVADQATISNQLSIKDFGRLQAPKLKEPLSKIPASSTLKIPSSQAKCKNPLIGELPPTPLPSLTLSHANTSQSEICQTPAFQIRGILKKSRQNDYHLLPEFSADAHLPLEVPIIPVMYVQGNEYHENFLALVGYVRSSFESLNYEERTLVPDVVLERLLSARNVGLFLPTPLLYNP